MTPEMPRSTPSLPVPDVSVVIVSWNVQALLADCLTSIFQNRGGVSHEVIVVDNASSDGTPEMLTKRFSWVKLIANTANIGFAKANNQGMKISHGRYVFLLNPDTLLSGDALEPMVQFLDSHPEVGMVGPKLCRPDGSFDFGCARRTHTLGTVFYCDVLQCHDKPLIGEWITKRYLTDYRTDMTQEVEAISGAAMMVRADLFRRLGGFGESFAHSGEDIDMCFRVRSAGWKIFFLSHVEVIHVGQQSSNQDSVRATASSILSTHEYFRRCFGERQAIIYRLMMQFIKAPGMVLVGVIRVLTLRESSRSLRKRVDLIARIIAWR